MTASPRPEVIESYTYRVETPDGTMFVTIGEIDSHAQEVHIQIGKSGTSLRAWTMALEGVITLALQSDISMTKIIGKISGHYTPKIRRHMNKIMLKSGIEGVSYALSQYLSEKRDEVMEKTGEHQLGDFLE